MKKFFIFAICILFFSVLTVVLGCGQNKNNADAAEINTAPLNYLTIKGENTNFYQGLSFEEKIKVMTAKEKVLVELSPTGTMEGIRFENGKVIINTGGKTFTFLNSSDNKQLATVSE